MHGARELCKGVVHEGHELRVTKQRRLQQPDAHLVRVRLRLRVRIRVRVRGRAASQQLDARTVCVAALPSAR